MEHFVALLALYAENPPMTGGFTRPVTLSFDAFFDLRMIKRLSKQSRHRWFETPSRSLCRYCNDLTIRSVHSHIWKQFSFLYGSRLSFLFIFSLRWRHNEYGWVSNHQPRDCLLNRLFRRRSKNTSKLRVTGLCAGNSPGTGEFLAQMASYAENVSIWWRHHDSSVL